MRSVPLVVMAAALTGCTSVFFQPTRRLYVPPEDLGCRYETVRLRSADGTSLAGLWMHPSTAPARGTVVQFHGNGENMTSHYVYAAWLAAEGYSVFAFDYRGYGVSEGRPEMAGAVADGAAAIDHVMSRPDIHPERVAVWGQSLGGALAVAALAQRDGPAPGALILESSFDSYRRMAQEALSRSALTWALQWPLSRALISDRYQPARAAARLPPIPTLVIHSAADEVVPYRLGERLYASLRGPKEFWRVEGARHLGVFGPSRAAERARLTDFLERSFRRSR